MANFGDNRPTAQTWDSSVPEARGYAEPDPERWLQLNFAERISYAGTSQRPLPADTSRLLPWSPQWTRTIQSSPSSLVR
jgi:hypothetical protein